MVAATTLEELGCRVEEAGSATEAVTKLRLPGRRIDVAIVDIGLPDRRGDGLAAELRAIRADLPIIIASGYGEDVLQGRFAHDPLVRFLPKPYNMRQLEEALRAVGVSAGSATREQG